MKSKVLSILLAIEILKIVGVVTYDIKCPHRSHWQLRAIQYKCQNEPFYHCLYDKNTKNLTEKCTKPDDIPSGFRAVLSGNLDAEKCSDTYFAPFMYWSNDSVECPYQKSVCAEEGQVILDNGSEEEDVKCFCDYRQGYEYIFKPKHDCYCSPTDEDCTCFRKKCKEEGSILTSDYICVTKDQVLPDMKCEMNNKSGSNVNEDHTIEPDEGPFPDTYTDTFPLITSLIVLGTIFTFVCVITIWFMSMKRKRGIYENEILWKNVKKLSKFPDLRKTLNKNCMLILKGRPGTGKNAIANSLKWFNRGKTCKIIKNQDLSEIKSFNKKETKLIIIVEYIENLESLLQPLKPTDILCDLDNDNFYDANDKKNILTFHRKRNNILSEDEWTQCQTKQTTTEVYLKKSLEADLCRVNTLKGFPWMCASLFEGHVNLGIRYFRQPPVELVSDIDKLMINGEQEEMCAIKYSLLVTVLLSNDDELTVDNKYLKSFKEVMKKLYPEIKTNFNMETLKNNLPKLMPRYLKNNNDSKLEFSHSSIYQAVLISFGKNHTTIVMNKCNISDLIFLLRPYTYRPVQDEMIIVADYSDPSFVKRVTDSLMGNASSITSIIEQLILFTETCETDFLQSILEEVKMNQSYTSQSRIVFFRHLDVFAHDFFESFDPELTAFCLAWDYVLHKLDAKEKNSNVWKQMADKSDFIKDFLRTCIDKYGNTLCHYFVIWNGQVEKSILFGTLSKYTKGVIDEQQVDDFIMSTECCNNESRTPLHFAAYFGRFDFLNKLKKLNNKKRENESWYHTLQNYFFEEHSTIDSLIESGERNMSEKIKLDKDEHIYFEEELIPSTINIKHGAHDDFKQIKFLLSTDRDL